MSHQATRKHKIAWILARVSEACETGKALEQPELIAKACNFFGAGHRYVKEILQDLVYDKQIVIDLGFVFTKQHFEALKLKEKVILPADKLLKDLGNGK